MLAPGIVSLPAAAVLDAAPAKSSGSSASGIVLIVLVVLFAGFRVRAPRRRARGAQTQRQQIAVGSRVVTRAGLIATVVATSDDEVTLEIAPGVHAHFVPQAIGRILPDETTARSGDGEPADGSERVYRRDRERDIQPDVQPDVQPDELPDGPGGEAPDGEHFSDTPPRDGDDLAD